MTHGDNGTGSIYGAPPWHQRPHQLVQKGLNEKHPVCPSLFVGACVQMSRVVPPHGSTQVSTWWMALLNRESVEFSSTFCLLFCFQHVQWFVGLGASFKSVRVCARVHACVCVCVRAHVCVCVCDTHTPLA